MTVHRCPDCRCSDDARPAQPATSTAWARRQALDAAAQAITNARTRRTTPTEENR
jgi:hypothetical protein